MRLFYGMKYIDIALTASQTLYTALVLRKPVTGTSIQLIGTCVVHASTDRIKATALESLTINEAYKDVKTSACNRSWGKGGQHLEIYVSNRRIWMSKW
jgi:hypothetical protein